MNSGDVLLNVGCTIAGFVLSEVYQTLKERRQFKREFRQNQELDLSGNDWIAAWQTSVDGQENINTEEIIITQKGGTISMCNVSRSQENPKGGFMWKAALVFLHGRDLMGQYFATKEEQNTSKGIMYFAYNSARKEFIGRWVGSAYDGPLNSGYGVICKNRDTALQLLYQIIQSNPAKVPIISYAM